MYLAPAKEVALRGTFVNAAEGNFFSEK
jgi:hypothetical protein